MAVTKNTINYVLNWIAFLLGLTTLITGIMRFSNVLAYIVINMGPVNVQLMNLIHRWSGLVTGAIILVHIILHWRWVFKTTKNLLGLRGNE
jgi:hypothetical protein